jgi:hypothetical protein
MRNDHRQPFDIEAREAADITQQFWGTTKGWSPHDPDTGEVAWDDRTPRSIQALRSSLAGMRQRRPQPSTSRSNRTRVHGAPQPTTPEELELRRREATLGELAAGWIDDDDWPDLDFATEPTRRNPAVTGSARRVQPEPARQAVDHEFEEDAFEEDDVEAAMVPLSPVAPLASRLGLGAVDPLLARFGAIVLVGVLLIPFALASRGGKADQVAGDVLPLAAAATASGSPVAPAASASQSTAHSSTVLAAPQTQTASEATAQPQQLAAQTAATSDAAATTAASASVDSGVESAGDDVGSSDAVSSTAADVPESAQPATTAPVEVATVSEVAARVEPDCSINYEAHAGDSWYRIADAAGITPKALIDHNLATLDTPIYPGDEICLPAGATIPSPPTTTSPPPPPTTAAPATTTTVKATTTTAPPPAPASTARVQELIREIWPDELEERALEIAWRESNYKATAYNGHCCYGVFQIHWTSHKSWLDDYGITSTNDLLDARKNITAAYALYQRAGGWGPWGG